MRRRQFHMPSLLLAVLASLYGCLSTELLAQEPTAPAVDASETRCCWINVKTGKKVASIPLSGINIRPQRPEGYGDQVGTGSTYDPGVAVLDADGKHAHNTRTGQNFVRSKDGCWIDVKTGKKVASVPLSGINIRPQRPEGYGDQIGTGSTYDPGVAVLDADGKHAHNTRTGDNFVRVSCDEPKTSGKIGCSVKQTNLFLGYAYSHTPDAPVKNLHGFNGSIFHNVTGNVALGGEVSGGYGSDSIRIGAADADVKVTRYTYLFGPQFSTCPNDNVRFFAHTLFGGAYDSSRTTLGTVRTDFSSNAFAMGFGGGVDIKVSPRVSIRAFQADYVPTRFGANWQNNFRVSTGIVLRFGQK